MTHLGGSGGDDGKGVGGDICYRGWAVIGEAVTREHGLVLGVVSEVVDVAVTILLVRKRK